MPRRSRTRSSTLSSSSRSDFRFVYDDADTLWDKAVKVATQVYGAAGVAADDKVRAQLDDLQQQGYGGFPICIAKTPYSFSTDPQRRGAPSGHVLDIRGVRLAAGARFVVLICGDVMTMPGLPKRPGGDEDRRHARRTDRRRLLASSRAPAAARTAALGPADPTTARHV